MATFCEVDSRMYGAAYIPFNFGEDVALKFLRDAIKDNFSVILIDTIISK